MTGKVTGLRLEDKGEETEGSSSDEDRSEPGE